MLGIIPAEPGFGKRGAFPICISPRLHAWGMSHTSADERSNSMVETATATSIGKDASAVELTILMPCLNEAETLATCIQKALGYLARSGVSGEVLIADNGSTDGSQEIARSLGARVID
ncbi:MAG: glycosyltransferase, partial [Alphaproteobacteria bacterium]